MTKQTSSHRTLAWIGVVGLVALLAAVTVTMVIAGQEVPPESYTLLHERALARAKLVRTLPGGGGAYAYVLQSNDGSSGPGAIHLYDAYTYQPTTRTVTLPPGIPMDLAISADGTQAYVAQSWAAGNTTYGDGQVNIVDLEALTVTHSLKLGDLATRIAVHPDGTHIYVSYRNSSGYVQVIDVTNQTATQVNLGSNSRPMGLAVTPDGERVYVANRKAANLAVISATTNVVDDTIPLSIGPSASGAAVAVHPDGTRAYVTFTSSQVATTDEPENRIVVVDIDPTSPTYHQETGVITTTGTWLQEMAFSPGGDHLYVASRDAEALLVVETVSNTQVLTLPMESQLRGVAQGPLPTTVLASSSEDERFYLIGARSARSPMRYREQASQDDLIRAGLLALSPDRQSLHTVRLADGSENIPGNLVELDPVTLEVRRAITLPDGIPADLSLSPDGGTAYVSYSNRAGTATFGKNHLDFIDLETYSVTHSIQFPYNGLIQNAVHPDGTRVYVTDRFANAVYVVDVMSRSYETVSGFNTPVGIEVTPDGSRVYVANRSARRLDVMDTSTDTVTDTVALNIGPSSSTTHLAISPDGKRAYVTYTHSDLEDGRFYETRVAVVDIDPGSPTYHQEIALIPTSGEYLHTMALSRGGRYLFVVSVLTDDVIVIDTQYNAQVWRIRTSDAPKDVEAGARPGTFYVASSKANSVQLIGMPGIYLPLVLR
jgi:YVTN family beta-propeller protein